MRPIAIAAVAVLALVTTVCVAKEVRFSAEWPDTDFSQRTVDLDSIRSGGPPKDGIPSIDDPQFVGYAQADTWLEAKEPVIAVTHNDEARAYPLQILTWHEIVNDRIGGTPVAVTFCPLCNASMVFDRRVEGRTLEFGVSGMLRKSDLVMYDRQSESWWQQFTGEGIVGRYAGTELTRIPSQIVAYDAFKETYPDGRVLSRDTGYSRNYGRNPYAGYDNVSQNPFMLDEKVDPRLPPMERALGVEIGESLKLYPFSALKKQPVVNDTVAGQPVVVLSRKGPRSALGEAEIADARQLPAAAAFSRTLGDRTLSFTLVDGQVFDQQTESRWDIFGRAVEGPLAGERLEPLSGSVHFAFAWLAFKPKAEIHGTAGE